MMSLKATINMLYDAQYRYRFLKDFLHYIITSLENLLKRGKENVISLLLKGFLISLKIDKILCNKR